MMSSDLLSQDEINALLSGGLMDTGSPSAPSSGGSAQLSSGDEKALKDIESVFSSSLQSVFGMLTGKEVSIENLGHSVSSQGEIVSSIEPNPFLLRAKCAGMGNGQMAIAVPQKGAQLLSDMMMGGEGKDLSGTLSELDISASQEGFSQVMGSAFTNLSSKLKGARLMPEGISAVVEGDSWELFPDDNVADVCEIKLRVSIRDASDFQMSIALPQAMVHSFAQLSEAANESKPAPTPPKQQQQSQQAQQQAQPQFNLPMGQHAAAQQQTPMVDVRPAEFSALSVKGGSGVSSRIDLVADIPVRVTVELGRTRRNISEVLNMSAGSIIELDKMAGEPVDVLVNGKLIAKGEVVVIDENFGVRITEIINSVSKAY